MKIIAYYALHYGREWLYWSMRALAPFVDEFVILYTDKPSYGFKTNLACPETKGELLSIAVLAENTLKPAVRWYDLAAVGHEGTHRDAAVQICVDRGADIILPIDHDEIWEAKHLERVLDVVMASDAKDYRISMQHYWRSVKWVCRDPLQPVRAIKPSGNGEKFVDPGLGMMHHFGYAQSPTIIKYKWQIHGHQAELRPGWLENKFMANSRFDVHPTNRDFWTPAFSDMERFEPYIGDHPYFHFDVIGDEIVSVLDTKKAEEAAWFDQYQFGGGKL